MTDQAHESGAPAPDAAAAPKRPADGTQPETATSRYSSGASGLVAAVASRWKVILAGVVAVIVVGAVLGKVYLFPTPAGEPVEFELAAGTSVAETAKTLARKGIVPSAFILKLWVAAGGATQSIMPGEYRFRKGTPYGQVVADLQKGTNIPQVKIVVPEGFTIRQIAKRLHEKAGLDEARFKQLALSGVRRYPFPYLREISTKSLEGYLFPKTYMIREGATEDQVLKRMVEQFGKDTAGLPWARAQKLGLTPYEIVTVASMVEKESSRDDERRRIAGVVYNRLTEGIPVGFGGKRLRRLQVDATVLYALGRDGGQLKLSDYRSTTSKYNTYVYEGLPPGPICNPGVASMYAALLPEDHDLFFYVAKGDGAHEFASTFEEFKEVKRKLGYGD